MRANPPPGRAGRGADRVFAWEIVRKCRIEGNGGRRRGAQKNPHQTGWSDGGHGSIGVSRANEFLLTE